MKKEIDATRRSPGRVATEVAEFLMGKDEVEFAKNSFPERKIYVKNVSKMNIKPSKRKGKVYVRYSGYPGGKKEETMDKLINRKGYKEVLKKAVYGMLPANKLRSKIIKNLIISE